MIDFPNIRFTSLELTALRFCFFGAGLGVLMGIGQLFVKPKTIRNWFLMGLFTSLGLIITYGVLVISGEIYQHPHLFHTDLPFLYLVSPLIYFLFIEIIDENFIFTKKYFLHFLSLPIMLVIMVPYYLRSAQVKKEAMMTAFVNFQFDVPEMLFGIGTLIAFLYFIALIIKGWFSFKGAINKELFPVALITLVVSTGTVSFFALYGVFTNNYSFILLAMSLIAFVLCLAYIIGRHSPEFYHLLQKSAIKQKYQRSLLIGYDVDDLVTQVTQSMKLEKFYENENLTLNDLAIELNLSQHQLSQLLNEKLHKNFSTFINEYRIEAAQEMLIDPNEDSILGIGYKVGFNSKSAFNRAFAKIAGMAPTEYRRTNKN